jgi:hypothetical protein
MRGTVTRLFVFRRLLHDPQSVLAAVYCLALVGIKSGPDFILRLIFSISELTRLELSIASFADADTWNVSLYDAELALLHNCSLAHSAGRA